MTRTSVTSSNIRSVGYNRDNKTLEVEFNHNSTFQYENVSQKLYDGLRSATSHGRFFDAKIKDKFTYKKVS